MHGLWWLCYGNIYIYIAWTLGFGILYLISCSGHTYIYIYSRWCFIQLFTHQSFTSRWSSWWELDHPLCLHIGGTKSLASTKVRFLFWPLHTALVLVQKLNKKISIYYKLFWMPFHFLSLRVPIEIPSILLVSYNIFKRYFYGTISGFIIGVKTVSVYELIPRNGARSDTSSSARRKWWGRQRNCNDITSRSLLVINALLFFKKNPTVLSLPSLWVEKGWSKR